MQQDYPKIVSNRLRFCYNRMYCSDSGLHKQGGFSNFAIPKFNSSLMTNADTDIQELSNFLLDFATTLMGVGSHTSRVVRNVNRIAESFGYGVDMTIFQRNITMTVKHADDYSIRRTYVRRIPALALSFRTISDLSSLSWEADEILDSEDIHVWHSLKYLPIYILEMIKNDPNDLFHHFFPLSLNRIFRRGALILRAEIIPNNLIRVMPA